MPVQKISDSIRYLKILLYGDTGTGKTWLAGSAAEVEDMRPVLYADFEDGVLSIRDRDVDLLPVRDYNDLRELTSLLKQPDPEDEDSLKYKTLVIDSLTELYQLNMEVQLRAEQRPQSVPELRDWLKCTNKMKRFLRHIRGLPIHFIAICQARIITDEVTGAISRGPDLPGKLAGQVGHYFDLVGYLNSSLDRGGETVTRTLQLQPYKRVEAKDRSGVFGLGVEDPTMKDLYEEINE